MNPLSPIIIKSFPRNIRKVTFVTILLLIIGILLSLLQCFDGLLAALGIGIIASSAVSFLIYYYDQIEQRKQALEHLLYIAIRYVNTLQWVGHYDPIDPDKIMEMDPRPSVVKQYQNAIDDACLEEVFVLSGKVWFHREKNRVVFATFINQLYDPASTLDVYFRKCDMTRPEPYLYYEYIIEQQESFISKDGDRLCDRLNVSIEAVRKLL